MPEKQPTLSYAEYKLLIDERDLFVVILEMTLYLVWNNASRAQYLYKKYYTNIVTQQTQNQPSMQGKLVVRNPSGGGNNQPRRVMTKEEKNAAEMKRYYETAHGNLKRFEKNIFDMMFPKSIGNKRQVKWPLQEVTKSRVEDWILRIRRTLFPNKKVGSTGR